MAGAESLRREMMRAVLRYQRGEGRSNEWSHGRCGVSKRNGEGAQILEGGCDRVSDHMASVDTHTRGRARARKERGVTMMLARPHAGEFGV